MKEEENLTARVWWTVSLNWITQNDVNLFVVSTPIHLVRTLLGFPKKLFLFATRFSEQHISFFFNVNFARLSTPYQFFYSFSRFLVFNPLSTRFYLASRQTWIFHRHLFKIIIVRRRPDNLWDFSSVSSFAPVEMRVGKISNLDDILRDAEKEKKSFSYSIFIFSRAQVEPKPARKKTRHEQLRMSFGQWKHKSESGKIFCAAQ